MNFKFAASLLTIALFSVVLLTPPDAQARGRSRGGSRGRGGSGNSQQMMAAAMQSLAMNQQILTQAEAVISEATAQLSTAQDQLEGARKSIDDAKTSALDSTKSQKTIEAEILTAQGDDSEYSKANLAFLEAQQLVKDEKEGVLTGEDYLKQKSALQKGSASAVKVAQLQKEALEEDDDYQRANDKFKAATLTYNRIKGELFKANPEWVAASQAAREAHSEGSKASGEATRGAMKSMPAKRRLREATEAAAQAKMNIAQAQMVLSSMGGSRGRGGKGMAGGMYGAGGGAMPVKK
jgi:hypothetical protein